MDFEESAMDDPDFHSSRSTFGNGKKSLSRKEKKRSKNNRSRNTSRAGSRPSTAKSRPPRSRPGSAPGHRSRSAQEAWLDTLSISSRGYHSGYSHTPRHKSSTEYFVDTLRRTGKGLGKDERKAPKTFSGLARKQEDEFPYLSTTHYLRMLAGLETSRRPRSASVAGRTGGGKPNYKDPEDYYEEILNMKKEMRILIDNNSALQSKLGRLEKDNLRKERDIEQLLNPGQNNEMRRTLGDRKPDANAQLYSLKKKILNLEQRLREKETQFTKLQTSMKYTKVEELKVQRETMYQEIVRLSTMLENGHTGHKSSRLGNVTDGSVSDKKLQALNDVILRLSDEKKSLQEQNQKLLRDLDVQLDSHDRKQKLKADYGRLGKNQLLDVIDRLERRIGRYEGGSDDNKNRAYKEKLVLSGTDAQRLDALDKRETELLAEVEKQTRIAREFRKENDRLRGDLADRDIEVQDLKQDVEDLQAGRPLSPRRKRRSSRPSSARSTASNRSRRSKDEYEPLSTRERRRKATGLREINAARKIQRLWKEYTFDKAAVQIQGTLRSHYNRLRTMERIRGRRQVDSESEDDILQIQSAFRGHMARQERLKGRRSFEDDSYNRDRPLSRDRSSRADRFDSEEDDRRSREGYRSSRDRSRDRYKSSRDKDDDRDDLRYSRKRERSLEADEREAYRSSRDRDDFRSSHDRDDFRSSRDRDDFRSSRDRDDFRSSRDRDDFRSSRDRSSSRQSRDRKSSRDRVEEYDDEYGDKRGSRDRSRDRDSYGRRSRTSGSRGSTRDEERQRIPMNDPLPTPSTARVSICCGT